MDNLDFILKLLTGLTSVAGVFIALAVVGLTLQQHRDSWRRSFSELHYGFWSDDDFRKVRSWIANDDSYPEIDDILRKRFIARQEVSEDEYRHLEKLDKFFNFFLRAYDVATRTPTGGTRRWKLLFFQFWLDEIVLAKRHRLWRYFQQFYEENDAYLPFTVDEEEFRVFKDEALGATVER